MIYYAQDYEQWEDEEDESFKVPMTPECSEDINLAFNTQEDFWGWYHRPGDLTGRKATNAEVQAQEKERKP